MKPIAALVALAAAAAFAQPPAAAAELQPAPDSAERREMLKELVTCVAKVRPRWARQTVALPYLSDEQAKAAAEMLQGRDSCLPDPEMDMTFRTSTLVGILAEHFIQAEAGSGTSARMVRALTTATALNASEDLALCTAVRNPQAARELALSEPGSATESRTAQQLARHVPACTMPGEDTSVVDLQALRSLTAMALYRAMTSGGTAGNQEAKAAPGLSGRGQVVDGLYFQFGDGPLDAPGWTRK